MHVAFSEDAVHFSDLNDPGIVCHCHLKVDKKGEKAVPLWGPPPIFVN